MRRQLPQLMAASAVLLLSACQTTASSAPAEAMLMKSSPATTAMLSDAVSQALGGVKVTLADDVLMKNSTLTVETKIAQSMDSNRSIGLMNDRARPAADRFTLMKEGRSCYLLHENSGQKMPLGQLECQAP